ARQTDGRKDRRKDEICDHCLPPLCVFQSLFTGPTGLFTRLRNEGLELPRVYDSLIVSRECDVSEPVIS
ncbi:hypothetical protein DPMN_118173, partial [Dreissena polymorpha]